MQNDFSSNDNITYGSHLEKYYNEIALCYKDGI